MRARVRHGSAAARPAPGAAPTSKPTPERQRHAERIDVPDVDGTAFRPWWRVSTRLDALLRDGFIDRAAWQAGVDFRATWERAFGIGLAREIGIGGRATHDDRVAASRLDAARKLRTITDRLGGRAVWLIEQCAVHDMPWRGLASEMGCSDKTARQWTAEVLSRLG